MRARSGGLSGRPLFEPSTRVLRQMRQRVGARLVLVGVGGIASGADAYDKIRAGASLVQLYTALAYRRSRPGCRASSANCSPALRAMASRGLSDAVGVDCA